MEAYNSQDMEFKLYFADFKLKSGFTKQRLSFFSELKKKKAKFQMSVSISRQCSSLKIFFFYLKIH